MNSLSFSSIFIINTEPIEQIINGIFANKYGKIMINYDLFDLSFSPFCKYWFMFSQTQKHSVYCYSALSFSIND
jgi:hypothetical protein